MTQLLQDQTDQEDGAAAVDCQFANMRALVIEYRGVIEVSQLSLSVPSLSFSQELTQNLSLLVKERQLKKQSSSSQCQHHQHQQRSPAPPPSSVSQRARRIAQTTFNLSDAEVDDLLSDDTPVHSCQVLSLGV